MLTQLLRYTPVIALIRRNRPRRVLEIGSGSEGLGKFVTWPFVAADVDFTDYTGADRPPGTAMSRVRAAASELPFAPDAFDLVLLVDVLEHVPPVARATAVREAHRVARGMLVIAFPSGGAARAHDAEFERWLATRSLAIPGWLREHLAHPYPTAEDVLGALPGNGASARVFDNEWLPAHRLFMRCEAAPPLARYSALLSDVLAPRAWRWGTHRAATNLLRIAARPAFPLVRLLSLRPGYRKVVVVVKRSDLDGRRC